MKTVIEMARAAGCHDNGEEFRFVEFRYLERFAELVRADEREACAKVCDAAYDEFFAKNILEYPKARYDQASVTRTVKAAVEFVTEDVAAAIRARSNT